MGLVEENNDFTMIHTQNKCKLIKVENISKPYNNLILTMGSAWAAPLIFFRKCENLVDIIVFIKHDRQSQRNTNGSTWQS